MTKIIVKKDGIEKERVIDSKYNYYLEQKIKAMLNKENTFDLF